MEGPLSPAGALHGLKVVELAAIGPVPFAATMLADHGASVLRIKAPGPELGVVDPDLATHLRGRATAEVDLRRESGRDVVLSLLRDADILLEGSRPGAMERRGLAPEVLWAANPRLVIGRMTGWGQDGPRAMRAGHDLNYLGVSGALRQMARAGQAPVPPLNLVADFGGGAMFLLFGVLAAVWESQRSGRGQVVDAAMVDGAVNLMGLIYSMRAQGMWPGEPGENLLDTGAPFYDVYATSDGRFVAVGCLEPQFYAAFLAGLGLAAADLPDQYDTTGWPLLRKTFAEHLGRRSRAHWTDVFAETDACVTPVWGMDEAPHDPHMAERGSFVDVAGNPAPAPAPRMSRTPPHAGPVTGLPGDAAALATWGVPAHIVDRAQRDGALPPSEPSA